MKNDWIKDFDKVFKENDGFGVNCFSYNIGAKEFFLKISKLGADIKIVDYENADIILPEDKEKSEQILLYVLTCGVYPTEVIFFKKDRRLSLTWS